MQIKAFDIKTHMTTTTEICDYCYRQESPLYNTAKLGLHRTLNLTITKDHETIICEDCMLFHLQLIKESRHNRNALNANHTLPSSSTSIVQ